MTILVTGGAGYIGSHVIRQLGKAGHKVIVYDNLSTGHRWAITHGELVEGDLEDQDKLEEVFQNNKFEAVMHFAASIDVSESSRDPAKYYRNNVINSLKLWQCCSKYNVPRIIYSSSAAVYGLPEEHPVEENIQLSPISPYGASKMMAERMLNDITSTHGLRHVILRYFNVAGADPLGRLGEAHNPETHLVPLTIKAALLDEPICINGIDFPTEDGTCVRDYIHVEDLAAAHLSSLEYLEAGQPSTTLNCGYGQGYSVRQIIKAVKEVTNVDFPVVVGDRRVGDPPYLVAAVDRIRKTLTWEPKFNDLQTIIKHGVQWEKVRAMTG